MEGLLDLQVEKKILFDKLTDVVCGFLEEGPKGIVLGEHLIIPLKQTFINKLIIILFFFITDLFYALLAPILILLSLSRLLYGYGRPL